MREKGILKQSNLTLAKEYLLITFGVTLYALGWAVFLGPHNMIGGGVTGFSAIIDYAFGVDISITYFVLNILLLLIGMKILGTGFGFKTIYAIIMTSIMLKVTREIPSEFVYTLAADSKIVCTILGGIMAGIGIGVSMSQGGSTGGTDIIALVWCKFKPASPGRVILIIDLLIIASAMLFPMETNDSMLLEDGTVVSFVREMNLGEKLATVVYGLMQVTVCGYAIDLYISGSKQSVQVFIFTNKVTEMADAIAFDMKRGVTVLPAKGWYSKEEKQVLMVVTRKSDLNLLLRYVKTIDSEAFLSVSSVMGVYGQGFDTIKVKPKK